MNVLVVQHAWRPARLHIPWHSRDLIAQLRSFRSKSIMASLRWAFKCSSWQPDQSQWLLASSSIQPEEKHRIGQFVFTKDAKSSMAGRLLARKAIHESLKISWTDINLVRTDRGKPYLKNMDDIDKTTYPNFNFNASHHGDFAVLATEPALTCGVDVMKVVRPNQKMEDFFRNMKKQFTPHEWNTIMSAETQYQQLHRFYRYWCLKESYIKALGIGLGFDLQRAEFRLNTLELSTSSVAIDTELYLRDRQDKNWVFQEMLLDEDHYVAVALQLGPDRSSPCCPSFTILTPEQLLSSTHPMHPEDMDYWTSFASKQEAPNLPNRKPLEKD
ncbi:L-aminoadipate-semialdehyde dehydrogenase-phosphopantetheinyl transferase [Strongylocentrotus purpuratus]|uniref:L-aminoadipate-semialdehyde dehydrogenase-phosphopantetheinyl transferase n=1 Tax=Strongylocentrotus purpuratus TaxID=7668 RepID=A0A7M7SWS5_STRPU|nr:L-aminoadipate-semialdehyde dehydrogenase-phosphopantetheinyl transferase [Strongylocentrotus purpuratus]XP_030837032.1 L-aminoadipate-semialdehyde dehydrogenase-phosphopantetheinyl transferase [Strongylocentrotus purpuratus]XP_030837033.1 L-aminoadipate-semialdehyde dehydrogenase-phosphopantetheinyl transferase [Strongylocentrotus purpuratus]XP_030837034.1 L-aminoadipate-semialdehyde dehydrogenase-phosphopantetheinyl transferase [Strongylocentrotus purpuratus]|eukprot:XP_786735.2 PREDICTED: L-aminoadipate-semialdehyde dehydrogenase-phosphopantetheinyl transferase [Strongylocentrotus purpuratus]